MVYEDVTNLLGTLRLLKDGEYTKDQFIKILMEFSADLPEDTKSLMVNELLNSSVNKIVKISEAITIYMDNKEPKTIHLQSLSIEKLNYETFGRQIKRILENIINGTEMKDMDLLLAKQGGFGEITKLNNPEGIKFLKDIIAQDGNDVIFHSNYVDFKNKYGNKYPGITTEEALVTFLMNKTGVIVEKLKDYLIAIELRGLTDTEEGDRMGSDVKQKQPLARNRCCVM